MPIYVTVLLDIQGPVVLYLIVLWSIIAVSTDSAQDQICVLAVQVITALHVLCFLVLKEIIVVEKEIVQVYRIFFLFLLLTFLIQGRMFVHVNLGMEDPTAKILIVLL